MRVVPTAAFAVVPPSEPARAKPTARLAPVEESLIPQVKKTENTLAHQWQQEAYGLMLVVGQASKVLHIKANRLAQCRLRPVYTDSRTGDERTLADILNSDNDDETSRRLKQQARAVKRVDDGFVAPIGGQGELLRKASLNLSIGGEAFLVGTPTISAPLDSPDSPELTWEFLSPLEVTPDKFGTGIARNSSSRGISRTPGKSKELANAFIARIWNSAPGFSEQPTSGIERALPDLRQYVKLRQVIDASADTRIPAGLLAIPDGLNAVGAPQDSDAPEEEGARPFSEELTRHLLAAFTDPESASRLLPLLIHGPPELLAAIELISLGDEQNATWASALRQEVLKAVADDIDAPAEMMEGTGDRNHSGALLVSEDLNTNWVIPQGQFVASFTTTAYQRPMLTMYEGFTPEQALNWRYALDPSNITARADRGVTALRLDERGLLLDETVVEANGFSVSDMPDRASRKDFKLLNLVERAPALAPVLLPLVRGFEDMDFGPTDQALERAPLTPRRGDAPEPTGQSGGDPASGGDVPETRPGQNLSARLADSAERALAVSDSHPSVTQTVEAMVDYLEGSRNV